MTLKILILVPLILLHISIIVFGDDNNYKMPELGKICLDRNEKSCEDDRNATQPPCCKAWYVITCVYFKIKSGEVLCLPAEEKALMDWIQEVENDILIGQWGQCNVTKANYTKDTKEFSFNCIDDYSNNSTGPNSSLQLLCNNNLLVILLSMVLNVFNLLL